MNIDEHLPDWTVLQYARDLLVVHGVSERDSELGAMARLWGRCWFESCSPCRHAVLGVEGVEDIRVQCNSVPLSHARAGTKEHRVY